MSESSDNKKAFYKPEESPQDYNSNLGDPGSPPYTRGIYEEMYRKRHWTMRQYAGYASAEESNIRYKYLLEQGNTGLSVAFDLPTQIGYDSDSPKALGEVGRVGVAIDSILDMDALFSGIDLENVSTSMTINATAPIILLLYAAVAESRGSNLSLLSGTIQNDILKEYIARGTYIYPPAESLRLITDLFAYCSRNMPNWNTISISGYHIREAGSTAIQELAFTFANAITYSEAAINAGLEFDSFAPRISFFFNCHNDFFEEVAKFRASRRIWYRIANERFKSKNPKSMALRFHTQTAGSTLTAQQPYVNIARTTLQALSAVLGGTQSLHTNSFDEALALPTEESVRIALRSQQIIAFESGVDKVADPLGGSWFIERLTDEIETGVFEYIEKIDGMGGALNAIEKGYIQDEIADSAYKYQQSIEDGTQLIVGVNSFKSDETLKPQTLEIDPKIAENQADKLATLKKERNSSAVESSLSKLSRAAEGTENTMPIILECVKSKATLGEISDALRKVFGEYKPR